MSANLQIDENLDQFATQTQRRYIDAIREHGGGRAAARALGVDQSTIFKSIAQLKKRAVAQGYSPEHNLVHVVPAPFVVRGHSTFYNKDGEVAGQWVKSKLDDQKYFEMLRSVADGMAESLPRLLPAPPPSETHSNSLLNLYVMSDAHIGMLASRKEGGAEWDLEIAERVLTECFRSMLDRSPTAASCVIGQLGDWMHFDGLLPTTARSGHVLDASGRFHDVMQAAIRVLRRLIDMALLRHNKVTLVVAEGNHDQMSANWLQVMFAALYEMEPRLTVIVSPKPYYHVQHGKTALFFTHGHLAKGTPLGLLCAAEFPMVWGSATKRYVHTGHKHFEEEKSQVGFKLVQHATLAARDAYTSREGYLSERQATATTYHSEFGEVGRVVVTPEMTA